MEKVLENHNPSSTKVIQCSPDQLRTIAERMEQESRRVTQNGEHVLYPLSSTITLLFMPPEKK